MIRQLFLVVMLLGFSRFATAAVPVTSPSSRVKADASLWEFRTQEEMDNLIQRNYQNPRASYYLLNNAYQKGFATHAAVTYLHIVRNKRNMEPNRWVSAAYAAMLGGGRYGYGSGTPNKNEFMEVTQYSGFLSSQLDFAVQLAPKSPEVLLMAAVCVYDSVEGTTDSRGYLRDRPEWHKLFSWMKQAQKLDPSWADAQYWYGLASSTYWEQIQSKNALLLPRAKKALLTAQRLDPNMAGSCAWIQWLVAEDLKRPSEQLHYMNIWFQWQPKYARDPTFQTIHARLVRQVSQ